MQTRGGTRRRTLQLKAIASGNDPFPVQPFSSGSRPIWEKPPQLPSATISTGQLRQILSRLDSSQLADLCMFFGLRMDFLKDETPSDLVDWASENSSIPELEASLRRAITPGQP